MYLEGIGMIDALISLDPVNITITRHTKVANAGGYDLVDAILDPIEVRLYTLSPRYQREYTLPEGEVKSVDYGLLARSTADIIVDHDSYDTFEHNGRGYRIISARRYTDIAVPEHLQCECVAI